MGITKLDPGLRRGDDILRASLTFIVYLLPFTLDTV